MNETIKRQLRMAKEVDEGEFKVTQWEGDFLESILKRLRDGGELTTKQSEVLLRMHTEYLGDD